MYRSVRSIGEEANPIGLGAVGGPHLAAVDDVVVAVTPRRRLDRSHVGPRADLRYAEAGDEIAQDRRLEEFRAHLIGPEPRQRGRRHVGLHADRHRHAAAGDVAELLGHGERVGIVEPLPAKLDRLGEAEHTKVSELLEQFVGRKNTGGFPFVDVGVDLRGDEFLKAAAQLVVLGGEQHGASYIRATPNVFGRSGRTSASRQTDRQSARTLRESRGSTSPSSHSRAVA